MSEKIPEKEERMRAAINGGDVDALVAVVYGDCPPDEGEKPDKWAAIEKAMREGKVVSIEPINEENWG